MRIVKRSHLLLLLSVALLLVCGQLPEFFTLVDDVSNDFVEESFASVPSAAESTPGHRVSQSTGIFETESKRAVGILPALQPLPASLPDLVPLFAIQRK